MSTLFSYAFAIMLCFGSYLSIAQGHIIDSLEAYAINAKPGWDKIDNAIGLSEIYVYERSFDLAQAQVDSIYTWSEQYNEPSGDAYALVMEGIIADEATDNATAAIQFHNQAIQVALETNDNNALAFAITELSKILIWNRGNTTAGSDTLAYLLEKVDETISLKNIGTIYKCIGYAQTLSGNQDEALKSYNKALSYYERILTESPIDPKIDRVSSQLALPQKQIGATNNDIGKLHLKRGELSEAIFYIKKALKAIEATKVETDMAWMYVNLAKVYTSVGDYGQSLEYIEKARRIYEAKNLESDIAWVDGVTTSLFRKLKDYETAEVYCKKNLEYLEVANPESRYYGGTLLSMVTIQFGKNDLNEAENYLREAGLAISSSDHSENIVIYERLKGELYKKQRKLDLALSQLKYAIEVSLEKGLENEYANNLFNIAEVFLYQANTDSSLFYGQNALERLKETNNSDLVKQCYLLLSKAYESKGEFENAYINHQAFFAYNDSLYTESTLQKLKSEQVRQDVLNFKNQKELAEQNAALLKEQNQIYLAVGVVVFIILILIGYLYLNLRRVKAKIVTQNDQLTQLNQTKDKFFGIIAHDIRSPLIGLQGVGDQVNFFLKKGKTEKLESVAQSIGDTSKKLTDLLDNLLNWALLQNGMIPYQPTKIDINQSVNEVFELLKPLAQTKGVELINDSNEDITIYADQKAVNTILRNLISNALKFTDAGGQISVTFEDKGNAASILINDTGTGISAEQLPRIFDLDKESKEGTRGEKGSGLGLILCRELVELNKGSIQVESESGVGSTFKFDLPKHSEAA